MSQFCACNGTLQNTGFPDSQRLISAGAKLIGVRLYADDGTRNKIASTDTIDDAYILALVANEDASKRWYPLPQLKNVDDTRGEPITESFNDGSTAITTKGVRTFAGKMVGMAPAYKSKVDSLACYDYGYYVVDKCGDLIGEMSSDGTELYPIRVNQQSVYANVMKQTDTAVAALDLSFEWHMLAKDALLRRINASEMSLATSLLDVMGLIDVVAAASTITTSGFDLAVSLDYDTFLGTDEPITGLTTSDFLVYNTTTSSAVTVTGATEAPDGTYAITFAAQTSADVLRVRVLKSAVIGGYWSEITVTLP